MKRVKKAINSYAMLTPFDSVGFIVEAWDVEVSMSAARIFCKIEKKYPSRVVAFVPEGVEAGWIDAHEMLRYRVSFKTGLSYKEARRRLLETIVPLARRRNILKLILPHPLEDVVFMFVDSIYRLDVEELASLTPKYEGAPYTVLNPYYKVSRVELRLYHHFHSGPSMRPLLTLKGDKLCKYSKFTLRFLQSHAELLYSTSYSSEVVGMRLARRLRTCQICGLASYGKRCTVHSKV